MTAESAVNVLDRLADHGVEACVGGGWAVDALPGQQTREHSDLDLWVAAPDLEPLIVTFADCGLDRTGPWPGDRPWNFVVHNGAHLRVDLHLYEPLTPDTWYYGSVTDGEAFPTSALRGRGAIAGAPVRCESPEWAVRWHNGYPVRAVDRHDIPLLCQKFGFDIPNLYR